MLMSSASNGYLYEVEVPANVGTEETNATDTTVYQQLLDQQILTNNKLDHQIALTELTMVFVLFAFLFYKIVWEPFHRWAL